MLPIELIEAWKTARHLALAAAVLSLLSAVVPGRIEAREISPNADLCAEINAVAPGEELVLAPGEYQGPCAIRRGGEMGAPLVIRAADPARRPRIVYGGRRSNVFEVRANYVTIRGLEFGPTESDVDAVRIFAGSNVIIEDCHFNQLGGIAVVANHASIRGLMVRRNVIRNSLATAIYFGCHDGIACTITGLVLEGNFIDGVKAPDPQIGYGMEVKLNSTAIIRDNVVLSTKGPGIMVYGSIDLGAASLLERNVTIGSRTSSGILIGGGPAIVRNNIVASNEEAGIGLQDYKKRGLLRGIFVANNTMYGNRGGVFLPETGISGVVIINNAAGADTGQRAFPAPQAGLRMAGNVQCAAMMCFANPEQNDFSPHAASLLRGAGVFWGDMSWMPREDFFGVRRPNPPTVGAIERRSGPISLTPHP